MCTSNDTHKLLTTADDPTCVSGDHHHSQAPHDLSPELALLPDVDRGTPPHGHTQAPSLILSLSLMEKQEEERQIEKEGKGRRRGREEALESSLHLQAADSRPGVVEKEWRLHGSNNTCIL